MGRSFLYSPRLRPLQIIGIGLGKEATTQEKLQEIAGKIGKNCKIKEIVDNGHSIVTIYENEALSIRYWIHDSFGHISEITEARFFC